MDAIHRGPASPEGGDHLPLLWRQNWGTESVTLQLCVHLFEKILLCPKGSRFTQRLKTGNTLRPVALLLSDVV